MSVYVIISLVQKIPRCEITHQGIMLLIFLVSSSYNWFKGAFCLILVNFHGRCVIITLWLLLFGFDVLRWWVNLELYMGTKLSHISKSKWIEQNMSEHFWTIWEFMWRFTNIYIDICFICPKNIISLIVIIRHFVLLFLFLLNIFVIGF